MIDVGVTAVAEHPTLAADGKTSTLLDLARYFPIVELDTTYYGIPKPETVMKWQQQVPKQMRFIVKATAFMTLHERSDEVDVPQQFATLADVLKPLVVTHQLAAILFQLPPYCAVTPTNVRYLRRVRERYPDLPVAVEFRHDSWYLPQYRESTLALLRELRMIHVVVDEPQTPSGSVPLVPVATNAELTIMRLHGRNYAGWQNGNGPGWRSRRTNYRYQPAELEQLLTTARSLKSRDVAVIFNNNGGGDAAANAQQFIAKASLDYPHLAPRQLDLF
ncbi:DUF72 domain-containing protein [Lacticaseibacillus sp. GG6-2]